MPGTTTTAWPSLLAGQRARASDVVARTTWMEQHIFPMNSGATTDLAYDLGNTTAAHWRCLYTGSINGTTTARGVAIGTTAVSNNSSVALEIAGTRAVLFPRLSTTQRDALTAQDGMAIYNSTAAQFQAYENGSWVTMAGAKIGLISKVRATTNSTSDSDLVNILVSGRLVGFSNLGQPAGNLPQGTITIDGSVYSLTSTTVTTMYLDIVQGDTTATIDMTTAAARAEIFFKTSLRIQHRTTGTTITSMVIYERA